MAHQEITSFEFEPSLKIQIHARYRPTYLTFAFQLCNILTLSLLYRFCTWFPILEKHLFTLFCKDFQEATHVFVQSSLGPTELIKLKRIEDFGIFDYHGSRFLLQKALFVSLNSLPRTSTLHASLLFGPNKITFVHRSYFTIFYERVLSPYNLFQYACMILWALQGSWTYVYVIASVTFVFAAFTLKEDIEAQHGMRKITKIKNEFVVMSDGSKKRTVDLLPGDLICLPLGPVAADVVLRSGTVLVDESMLNGESAAVAKTGTNTSNEDSSSHQQQPQHTLYAGTLIKSSTPTVIAMVWATGHMTAHSKMLQAIAYPRQHSFPFYEDVRKVTMVVLLLSSIVALFTLVSFMLGQCPWKIVVRSTDLFAIIFELYYIIATGALFAQGRLRIRGIICRVADNLMPASSVNTVCFDKTGTLTEDSMRLLQEQSETTSDNQRMVMAACHALHSVEGILLGDVMDLEAFKASGASITLDNGIILNDIPLIFEKSFFFCPRLRRQTVLLTDGTVLTKGAPESISEILTSIPNDYDSLFREYTRKGFRVIACAIRRGAMKSDQRTQLEMDMEFAGFLVYENVTRTEARPCVQLLQASRIDCLMVTGDSPLTAIAVARQVNILSTTSPVYWSRKMATGGVSSFVWQNADSDEFLPIESLPEQIVLTGDFPAMHRYHSNVYARMSSTQKSELVTSLRRNHGRVVAFCGDGANDCAAMCASDAGIAMSAGSDSAALAASFLVKKLDSVPEIIRQARASLATTLALVKLFILSTAVQLLAMAFSFPRATLSNGQIIYIDAICMTTLDFSIARTPARKRISKTTPPSKLLNMSHALYFSTHLLLILLTFVSLHIFAGTDLDTRSNVVFFTTTFMILSVGCLSARPDKYRTSFNISFAITLLILLLYTCHLMYEWFSWNISSIIEWLEITIVNDTQRRIILYHSAVYCSVSFAADIVLTHFIRLHHTRSTTSHPNKLII